MKTIYTVCGLGYNQNDKITDCELYFGEFDNYEQAYDLFVKLQSKNPLDFFKTQNVSKILLQVEECEENEEETNCINIKNEWWIENSNY